MSSSHRRRWESLCGRQGGRGAVWVLLLLIVATVFASVQRYNNNYLWDNCFVFRFSMTFLGTIEAPNHLFQQKYKKVAHFAFYRTPSPTKLPRETSPAAGCYLPPSFTIVGKSQ
jgi:hypothetical protein